MNDDDPDRRLIIRRFTLVTIVLPALAALVSAAAAAWLARGLPGQIPVHWGVSGDVDGYGSPWVSVVMILALGLLMPVALGLAALPGLRRGHRGPSYRILGAAALGLGLSMDVLSCWLLLAARSGQNSSPWPGLGAAVVAGVVGGGLAWWLQPQQGQQTAPEVTIPDLTTARPVLEWRSAATPSTGVGIAIAASLALGIFVLISSVFTSGAPLWLAIVVAALLVLILATTVSFNVRVDADGLNVTSMIGWPAFHYRLSDITHVTAVDVNALGDFGGMGVRRNRDGWAVVLSSGPGIQVTLASGGKFTVVAPGAPHGAAILQLLIEENASSRQ